MSHSFQIRQDQWIVQGDDVASGQLMEIVKTDAEIRPVRQIAKDILVLGMSPERADRLRKEFGARLIVERDGGLNLNMGHNSL
ncbi:MAG: hypothetical protein LBP99_07540 [Azoarcus sp.]|jgi:hypothetical protein|nr:hypothetical protein [Azoarcus sp.]